MLYEVNVTWVI